MPIAAIVSGTDASQARWVFGVYPQWSILPYDLALVIGRLTGWYEPPSDPFWPLWFEEP